jgi:hypothetical protein
MTAIGTAAGWAGAQADPRVAAIVPISAVIEAEMQSDTRTGPNAGFDAQQLGSIVVPVMLIGGTEDVNVPIGNNDIAFEQITSAPVVYKVDIIGANHTHFANVCTIGDFLIDSGITQESWPSLGAEALLAPYEATCSPEAFRSSSDTCWVKSSTMTISRSTTRIPSPQSGSRQSRGHLVISPHKGAENG